MEGEYGLSNLAIGVPVILGKNGVEKIEEIELSEDEKSQLSLSAEGVLKTNDILVDMGLF